MPLPVQLIADAGRASLRSLALGACAIGCAAAPAADGPGPEILGATEIALGVGDIAYEPLAEGAQAQVIHGPQGGYHIVVSVLAHGIWPGSAGVIGATDNPVTTLRAFRDCGMEIDLRADDVNVLHSAYLADGDGAVLLGRFLRLDIRSGAEVANQRLLLTAEVVDRDQRTAMDQKHVIAIPPAN